MNNTLSLRLPASIHEEVKKLAIREGIPTDNPARRLHVPGGPTPHPQVWTTERVAQWRATGIRPAVAVWTVAHLATFLDLVTADRLFAVWWLIALRGLHRGEAAGLRWCPGPAWTT